LDLHAHGGFKGCFLFGNYLSEFKSQVETEVFAHVMDKNSMNFQKENSRFTFKHMKCRDYNEKLGKQGCGRVVACKELGLIHSYTLECGYHSCTEIQPIVNIKEKYGKTQW